MKRFALILSLATAIATAARGEVFLGDVFARQTTSLNGQWHVIVDPYDTGYFDYRLQPFDAAAKPSGGLFSRPAAQRQDRARRI